MVAHPVVAYLRATPVPACQLGEGVRTSLIRMMVSGEEGSLWNLFGVGGAGTPDDGQAAASGQVCLQRLEGVNAYGSLVEASVLGVWLFCVGKRGEPAWAIRSAAL